jgi:1-acyl-sn-glycerol-3-phosphate acyltransferase
VVLPRKFDPDEEAKSSGEARPLDAKGSSIEGAHAAEARAGTPVAPPRVAPGAMRPWYRFAHDVVFGLGRVLCGLRVSGLEHLPSPPFIVAANHISLFDPPILGCVLPYEVAFMAKVELFQKPFLGPLIRSLNAFPVKRGLPDRDAIDRALATLRGGRALIMFPEGTRDRSALRIREPKFGVGLFAVSAQLPVVPAHMSGTNRFSRALVRAPRFSVAFGPPIMPPPIPRSDDPDARRVAYETVASAWHQAVSQLRASTSGSPTSRA